MEKKPAVLLVEDNDNIRTLLGSLLEKRGYTVFSAEDGERALQLVGVADAVLLDLFLPKVSGQEFLEKIRADGNYVPVVVMSASMNRQQAFDSLSEFKIVDFLSKPFAFDEMLEKIDKAVKISEDLSVVRKATDQLKGFIERQSQ